MFRCSWCQERQIDKSILTIRTEEAPLPVSVHTDVPHLALRLGVSEEPLPGAAGEGGGGGGGEDGIVQAWLTRHRLSQPVQRVARVRVTSRVGLSLGLGPTTALWPRSGGGRVTKISILS